MKSHRIWILPIAALLITAAVAWRLQREAQRPVAGGSETTTPRRANRQPAIPFTLANHSGIPTKLTAYLGRTRILILFCGANPEFDQSLEFQACLAAAEKIAASEVQILVVTPEAPYAIQQLKKRLAMDIPFPVLTDIDLEQPISTPAHRAYGLATDTTPPRPGLFLIGRGGNIAVENGVPKPAANPVEIINRISRGEWPGGEI